MGRALPFSEIDQYLGNLPKPLTGCIVDTQFLVASFYDTHTFFDDAEFLFLKLQEYKIPIYANVTTRSEFIDIQRRIQITEALMGMIVPGTKWNITAETKFRLQQLKGWIDRQAKQDLLPIFRDQQIKELKELFYPLKQSGKSGWLDICNEFLVGHLSEHWERLTKGLGINYLDMKEPATMALFNREVNWMGMCEVSEATCLSSSDSMILNMANSSVFPFIVSADFDLAYAVIADKTDKTILVPDKLYRDKVKTKQSWIHNK